MDILCVSKAVEQEGMDMTSMFFKTDHHWLPFTGIYMDGILCKTLNQKYDYAFYGYGDRALITVHNNNIHDGSRILMIKSSFADCMYPYLASVVENLDVIDLRAFDGSLQSYINETDPDTIAVVYGVASFEDNQIEGGLFDFR